MCVKKFIGFNCGHCAIPTLHGCPIASQSPYFPYCRFPAERPILVPENCPSCARVVWNQRTLANERSHQEMHYRLGWEECVFEGEKGGCETRFDIDIERERGGGERQVRHSGYERVLVSGQMQIETSGGNAERGEGVAGAAASMRHKLSKKDRRKSSREIEEAIARIEARFAAINTESSRRAAIEGAFRSEGEAYVAASGHSDNDPELHAQHNLPDRPSVLKMETNHRMGDYENPRNRPGLDTLSSSDASSPHFEPQASPGRAYIAYQFGNEAAGHGTYPKRTISNSTKGENDSGRPLHADHLSGERTYGVQNYIGTTKYYPGQEQYGGASWDDIVVNAKYKPGGVVPRGSRAKQERGVRFQGATQQFSSQMSSSNFDVLALGMNAPPVGDFRAGQSTPPEEISAVARQPEVHAIPTDPRTINHRASDGQNEFSPPNRPYHGPAIVRSDMANTGYT